MTEPRGRRKWRNRVAIGLVAAAVVAGLVWAWLPEPVLVEVARIERGEVVVELLEDGVTRVRDRFVVDAPVGGELLRIELEVGDPVAVGQIVAQISPGPPPLLDASSRAQTEARLAAAIDARNQATTALRSADLEAAEAARDLARVKRLVEGGAVARVEIERGETAVRLSAEKVASARSAVEAGERQVAAVLAQLEPAPAAAPQVYLVTAPVAGTVLRVAEESAGVVAPGTPLLDIGDPTLLEVVVDLLSADAVKLAPNAPATIDQWGGPQPLPAHVDRLEPSAFTKVSALGVEEQRVNVVLHIDLPREQWAGLSDGYRVEARILVSRADDVVVAPEAALFRRDGQHSVFAVVDDRAVLVPVTLGQRNGVVAEITDGLSEGDVVILHPSELLADGTRVRIGSVAD